MIHSARGKDVMRKAIAVLVLALASVSMAWAGPFEDAFAAYARGDYATALRIWRPLAENGNAQAQYSLGAAYGDGKGVPQDDGEALKWYRLAAAQGFARAQHSLGLKYWYGEMGVAQDYVRAHMWANLATAKGNALAALDRDAFAKKMSTQQIAEAQKLARECQARKFKGCD